MIKHKEGQHDPSHLDEKTVGESEISKQVCSQCGQPMVKSGSRYTCITPGCPASAI